MMTWSRIRFNLLCNAMLVAIYGLPAGAVWQLFRLLPPPGKWMAVLLAPLLYAVLFAAVAGLMSVPFHKGVVAGKFPRDLSHPVYRKRRYYGLCWTALYYCKPVYYLCLTLPWLKWLTFRLFGYRGQMDFTVYPDTWIRDLPLLELGKGAYIANRATLGTNMPLQNGKILVERVKVGAGCLVGHLTMLAAGVELGEDTHIESGTALGVFVKIGARCSLGAMLTIDHYSRIGDDCTIGTASYIAFRSRLPAGTVVPVFATLPKEAPALEEAK